MRKAELDPVHKAWGFLGSALGLIVCVNAALAAHTGSITKHALLGTMIGLASSLASMRPLAIALRLAGSTNRRGPIVWIFAGSIAGAGVLGLAHAIAGIIAGLVIFLALTVVAILRLRREEAALASRRCFSCGYDLGGLPIPICPECGAVEPRPID